jgi:hypothetical protein
MSLNFYSLDVLHRPSNQPLPVAQTNKRTNKNIISVAVYSKATTLTQTACLKADIWQEVSVHWKVMRPANSINFFRDLPRSCPNIELEPNTRSAPPDCHTALPTKNLQFTPNSSPSRFIKML